MPWQLKDVILRLNVKTHNTTLEKQQTTINCVINTGYITPCKPYIVEDFIKFPSLFHLSIVISPLWNDIYNDYDVIFLCATIF